MRRIVLVPFAAAVVLAASACTASPTGPTDPGAPGPLQASRSG